MESARSSTDRASDYGSEGWRFESFRAHRKIPPYQQECGKGVVRFVVGWSINHTVIRVYMPKVVSGDLVWAVRQWCFAVEPPFEHFRCCSRRVRSGSGR